MMRVGISEIDITPAPGLPRAGMPWPQKGQGTAWPLMARVFIFDDGIQKAALITLDLLNLHPKTVEEFRQAVSAGAGLAPTDVMISCTHTHWAPHTNAIMDEDADFAYLGFVCARLVEAMERALSALRPARLKVGCVEAPGWAFNRRPVYRTPFGEQVGTQGPQWVGSFVRMEGPDDPQLRAVLFEDEAGQPLGGLVNFTCHTTVGPDEPLYSADYPGPLTEKLAKETGGIFAYLQGCAGNIWQVDMSQPRDPNQPQNGTAYTRKMGEALARKAQEAIQSARLVERPRIRLARQVLRIPQRRPTRQQVEGARWFLEQRPEDVDLHEHMVKMYGHEHTFYYEPEQFGDPQVRKWVMWQEDWFARGIIGLWEAQRRSGTRDVVEDVEIQAIAIGDLALIGFPVEYFVEFGLKVKAQSPFPDTLVSELTNGWHGYVPTIEAFRHGGYEPRLGDASWLAPEAGDLLCETGIRLLKRLY